MNDAGMPERTIPAFLAGGGGMGALMRAHDWSASPLGSPEGWPAPLRTIVGVLLAANQPMFVVWDREQAMLYNDPYAELLGAKHPAALGRPFFEVWHELAADVRPIMDRAYAGEPTAMDDIELTVLRHGYQEEAHFSFFYAPLRDEAGVVGGVYCGCTEITARVFAERRTAFRLALDERLRDLADPAEVMAAAAHALGSHLGVARVGYAEADDAGWATVEREWNPGGLPSLVGRHQLDDYGQARIAGMRSGRTEVVADFAADPGFRQETIAAHQALGIRAQIVVPLVKSSRLVALLFVHAGVSRRWSAEEVAAVEDAAERTWAAVGRARAEADLRELNADLERKVTERTLARGRTWQVSPDLIGVLNSQGYFETSNPAWAAVLGWSEEEVARTAFLDFIHPEDLPKTRVAWADALGRGLPALRFENRYRTKDGQWRWLSWVAVPDDGKVYCSARDITPDKEREAELAVRTAERDRMWETSPDLMLVIDFEGVFRRVNPAWTTLLGYLPDELVGHHVSEFVVEEDHHKTTDAYELAASGGRPVVENRYRHRDGSLRWVSWVAAPEGDMTYATGRDITAEKARVAELEAAQEALRQSQKMEAVGQLTGGLAHDFNNLLTGIAGSLELLQTRIAQGRINDVDRYVNAAQGAARRAAALTHRLLAFSRRQTLDPKPVDLNRLVVGMEELIQRTMGPEINIEPVTGGGLWATLVDPSQLENALLNLCINARDAMPGGGKLSIETANRWLDERAAKERELPPGQYVSLCVSDNGSGMPPEVIARAFDPFFTTKPIGQGTGLGLSMIYGFVRQSGGQVRIYSEIGQGTTVCLYIPRHVGAAETGEEVAEPSGAPRAEQGETVLVVDDEPTVRMLVTEVLEDLGYTAIEATDGAAGLKVLLSDVRIDLLVTDVGLPGGMNGRQLADAARVSRRDLRVLFITGYAENAVLSHGHLDPGMQVMTKPFAMEALAIRIRGLIEADQQGR